PPPRPRHRRQVSYRPWSSIRHLGRGHWRGDGCIITPVDGRHSTHRAFSYPINDKLTVPADAEARQSIPCYLWPTMSTATTIDVAELVIATLRAHEGELRRAGIRHLSLFGSVARGDATIDSDVDLAVEFDPAARMDLFRLTALERRIAEIVGRRVDLLPEPVEKPRLRANVDRDRRLAF